MTNKQPEAMRLAYIIEGNWDKQYGKQVAAELRRLHEVNAELGEALRMLVEMCDAVGNFENGVTDETNSFDEGTFYAGQVIDKAKAAIAKATGEQQ